jgi:hypothetical protein
MWTADKIISTVTMTGLHQRTCVFGALCIDGRQVLSSVFCLQSRDILKVSKGVAKEVWKNNIVYR